MKSRILSLFILLIVPLMSFAENTIYYVSFSEGATGNDGLSESTPLLHIADVKVKKNITLRLKCDDVFFENISGYSDCIVESYGKGNKPILCGIKVLKNTDAWEYDKEYLCWRLDLQKAENFVGMPADGLTNNIGCIYDEKHDKIYGRLLNDLDKLKEDGDFYTTNKCDSKEVTGDDFRYLYFKYHANPSILGNLCFSTAKAGISKMYNCTIKDIAIIGFGGHGMGVLDHCTVADCVLDIIGGSIQLGKCPWVRFGNGIEFYITSNPVSNSIVRGCRISRTFDCGVTIQGSGDNMGDAVNIRFTNNRFIYCRQAFEHFMQSNGNPARYIDCSFDNNISLWAGDNQFGCPEQRDAAVLSYELQDKSCSITNNIFYGSNYYFGNKLPDGMTNNLVYLYPDQFLHHSHFRADAMRVLYSGNDVEVYRKRTGDKSTIVVLNKGSLKDLWLRWRLTKKIGWKKPELHLERIL